MKAVLDTRVNKEVSMENKSGLDLLAEYVFLSKYAQKKKNGEFESWDDSIERIYSMHNAKLEKIGLFKKNERIVNEVKFELDLCKFFEKEKKILSSQRSRQFASPNPNSGILKHEAKIYNCCGTFIDRIEAFGEIMYLLLCGCGVGYSLHKDYIEKLPVVKNRVEGVKSITKIDDSIEGWAYSIDFLINNLYCGFESDIDFSAIRKEGELIDGKFVAPGPKRLIEAHENIKRVFEGARGRKLKSIEIHDILCYIAMAVVSGGVRRSAMIALFDKDDEDMLKCKTGNWWEKNPQRTMANNSILTADGDRLNYAEYRDKISVIRQYGEPGFVNVPSYDYIVNPCGEIMLHPTLNGKTGFAFCNLVEINAEKVLNEEDFYSYCRSASFIATIQSLYSDFKYINDISRDIAKRDRAIGVSITGIFARRDIFTPDVLQKGAKIVTETNKRFADILGISPSETCTTIKPSGNASAILGLSCSGIHPAHAPRYFRRVRIKKTSPEYKVLKDTPMVDDVSVDEAVMIFPIVCKDGAVCKDDIGAVEHLKFVSMVKHYWVNKGTNVRKKTNNVSVTIEVADNEWEAVAAVLYMNDHIFTGVSLLPKLGDQIYPHPPFQRVSGEDMEKKFEILTKFIEHNQIDFAKILDGRIISSGDLVAIGCQGGKCEIL